MEEFKQFRNSDRYMIGNMGTVMTNSFETPRAMCPSPSKNGYLGVTLHGIRYRVHSLVAEAFLGVRPDGAEINHKNGDKSDNRAANLEYVTRKENITHAQAIGKYTRTRDQIKLRKLTWDQIDAVPGMYARGMTQPQIAEFLGVSQKLIWRILKQTSTGVRQKLVVSEVKNAGSF